MPSLDRRNVHLVVRLPDDSAWSAPLAISIEELRANSRHPIRWLMFLARSMTSTRGVLSLSSTSPLVACKDDEPIRPGAVYYYHQEQFNLPRAQLLPTPTSTGEVIKMVQSNGFVDDFDDSDDSSDEL